MHQGEYPAAFNVTSFFSKNHLVHNLLLELQLTEAITITVITFNTVNSHLLFLSHTSQVLSANWTSEYLSTFQDVPTFTKGMELQPAFSNEIQIQILKKQKHNRHFLFSCIC